MKMLRTLGTAIAMTAMVALPSFVLAEDKVTFNNIDLGAEVYEVVPRDELQITLNAFSKSENRQKINTEVTEKINKVFAKAKEYPEIEASLISRNTYPSYDNKNGKKTYWTDEARILIKGKDFSKVYKLVSEVQDVAAISSMNFSISDEKRKSMEKELLAKAIRAFRDKASFIAEKFGANGYELVDVSINNRYYGGGRRNYAMRAMNSVAEGGASAPIMDVESGNEKVSLSINGTVRINR